MRHDPKIPSADALWEFRGLLEKRLGPPASRSPNRLLDFIRRHGVGADPATQSLDEESRRHEVWKWLERNKNFLAAFDLFLSRRTSTGSDYLDERNGLKFINEFVRALEIAQITPRDWRPKSMTAGERKIVQRHIQQLLADLSSGMAMATQIDTSDLRRRLVELHEALGKAPRAYSDKDARTRMIVSALVLPLLMFDGIKRKTVEDIAQQFTELVGIRVQSRSMQRYVRSDVARLERLRKQVKSPGDKK